jgi:hypothetical protein
MSHLACDQDIADPNHSANILKHSSTDDVSTLSSHDYNYKKLYCSYILEIIRNMWNL